MTVRAVNQKMRRRRKGLDCGDGGKDGTRRELLVPSAVFTHGPPCNLPFDQARRHDAGLFLVDRDKMIRLRRCASRRFSGSLVLKGERDCGLISARLASVRLIVASAVLSAGAQACSCSEDDSSAVAGDSGQGEEPRDALSARDARDSRQMDSQDDAHQPSSDSASGLWMPVPWGTPDCGVVLEAVDAAKVVEPMLWNDCGIGVPGCRVLDTTALPGDGLPNSRISSVFEAARVEIPFASGSSETI